DGVGRYRLRLVEAMLAPMDVDTLLEQGDDAHLDLPLGTFTTTLGTSAAVAMGFEESVEAGALLTLLPIYETRSSAAFHATLKTLCDLYGLRKDEFDRVSNESLYLVNMNSARSDKARMLDHAVAGTIVEVGPGGGVVLDLIADRFPDSRVVGLDISHMVVEALRAKKSREGRRWEIVEGDAYEMPALMGPASVQTVVFCSVLHEIYSYVEHPCDDGVRRKFQLEAVRDLLRASYRTLAPGGRIVIRDGVMPAPATRLLEFHTDDGLPSLELFADQFEGRTIMFERVGTRQVRMTAADAMEFLYCYTWGPESFPYEVREQYGILTYSDYQRHLVDWLSDPAVHDGHLPQLVELPVEQRSYL